jgi:hypothetical protein
MAESHIRHLRDIVASLAPGPGTTAKDLRAAREQVDAALGGGQTAESALTPLHRAVLSAAPAERADIVALATAALLPAGARDIAAPRQAFASSPAATETTTQRSTPLVALRTIPLDARFSPLAADWARGLAVSKSHGPFVSDTGEIFWLDIFHPVTLVSLLWSPAPGLPQKIIALVPIRSGTFSAQRTIRLAAGSAWLPASLLVPGRPANEFVGVRIKSGSLALRGPAQVQGRSIVVSGDWHAELKLNLDLPAPPAPTPPASPVGADAVAAKVDLPAKVTLAFGRAGLGPITLSQAKLTAYGTSATLKRAQRAPFYDETTRSVVVPCEAGTENFAFAERQSTLFSFGPEAPLTGAGWALVTTVTTPDKLGQASGAGFMWLGLGKGLSAQWTGLPAARSLAKATLQLAPGTIGLTAVIAEEPLEQTFALWNEKAEPRRSSAVFAAPVGSIVFYFSQSASEGVLAFGHVAGHLDRPVAADGGRLGVAMPNAVLVLLQTVSETHLYLSGVDPAAGQKPLLALALENLLTSVQPPTLFLLNGPLAGSALNSGKLVLRFSAQSLLPTLPDPYAASFEAFTASRASSLGWVTGSVVWKGPLHPVLDFAIETGAAPASPANLAVVARETPRLFMLDLSSNADQFGVEVPVQSFAPIAVDGLAMVAPAASLSVFTLPPISWEPMLTKQPNPKDDAVLPPPPHDGGRASISAESVRLVPVAPGPLLAEVVDAVNGDRNFSARLPLPFGIVAHIDSTPIESPRDVPSDFIASGGALDLNQPTFAGGLSGARQLRLRAPDSKIAGMSRHFPPPSFTETEDTDNYAAGVLSNNINTRWQRDFGRGRRGVPLERYELTGYGASLFSDWRNQIAIGPSITQARFDVLVGRTGYEVIQMQSTKYPWCAKVVRIITIQRTNGGWVLREDSGWQPTTDGLFHFPTTNDVPGVTFAPPIPPAFADGQIHRGAIKGVVNIRNIRLAGPPFAVPPGGVVIFQPVKFDADVLIDHALNLTAGGFPKTAEGTRVPSRDIDGYIQITGEDYPGTINGEKDKFAMPADRATIFRLLAATGPAVGPVGCTAEVGGVAGKPGITLRASQTSVGCNDEIADPHLVAALRGTPLLPRDGAWSLGRMKMTDTAPHALDPHFAAPLVRPTGGYAGADKWHLADPVDIRKLGDLDKPTTIYGLVQATGTQKTFFARPQAIDGDSQIKLPRPPSFADVAALFNAAGIFPNLGDAFNIDALTALDVAGGEIAFDKQFAIAKIGGKPRETLLMNLSIVEIVLRYGDEKDQETIVHVKVDPAAGPAAPRWTISLRRVGFAVKYKSEDLIRLYADVKADEKTTATFANLNVNYVGLLKILQGIFANIQQVARFLPGGAGAGLQVGFSLGRLTVRNDFALPNLPLGTGEITDIAVAMGLALQLSPLGVEFVAGLGSSQKPFRWVVSPLAGTGVIQVGVNDKGLNILVQGGLGLGLAIDLGIAAGSAAIALAAELNTGVDPFELKAILSGRASVDVMRGLASATITLAAGLGIIPPNNLLDLPVPPDFPKKLGPYTIGFTASVAVGIHISVCWVLDIDWDDYWQFRQDITTPEVALPF